MLESGNVHWQFDHTRKIYCLCFDFALHCICYCCSVLCCDLDVFLYGDYSQKWQNAYTIACPVLTQLQWRITPVRLWGYTLPHSAFSECLLLYYFFCFWCFIWIFLNTLLCLLSVFVCLRALLCYKLFVILDFYAAYIWCGMCSRRETFYVSDKKPVRDSNDNVTPACAAATVPQTPEALSPQLDYRFSVGQLPSWAKRQVSQLSGRQKFV